MNLLSKLHKNSILTGPVESYCLACSCLLKSEEESYAHINNPDHSAKREALQTLDNYKDDQIIVIKNKEGYYCPYCNIILPTVKRVSLHVTEEKHKEIKESQAISRENGFILAYDSLVLSEKAWNGLDGVTCFVCNEDYLNEDHITDKGHVLKLIQSKCEFGETYVYRKVDDDFFFCLICGDFHDNEEKLMHHDTEVHLQHYKSSKQLALDSRTKKIEDVSEPNNNTIKAFNEAKSSTQVSELDKEASDIKPKHNHDKSYTANENTKYITENSQEKANNTNHSTKFTVEDVKIPSVTLSTENAKVSQGQASKLCPQNGQVSKTAKLLNRNAQSKLRTNNAEAQGAKFKSQNAHNKSECDKVPNDNNKEPHFYKLLKSQNFVAVTEGDDSFCTLCDCNINTSIETHSQDAHHQVLYTKHKARKGLESVIVQPNSNGKPKPDEGAKCNNNKEEVSMKKKLENDESKNKAKIPVTEEGRNKTQAKVLAAGQSKETVVFSKEYTFFNATVTKVSNETQTPVIEQDLSKIEQDNKKAQTKALVIEKENNKIQIKAPVIEKENNKTQTDAPVIENEKNKIQTKAPVEQENFKTQIKTPITIQPDKTIAPIIEPNGNGNDKEFKAQANNKTKSEHNNNKNENIAIKKVIEEKEKISNNIEKGKNNKMLAKDEKFNQKETKAAIKKNKKKGKVPVIAKEDLTQENTAPSLESEHNNNNLSTENETNSKMDICETDIGESNNLKDETTRPKKEIQLQNFTNVLKTVSQFDNVPDDLVVNGEFVLGNLSFMLVVHEDTKYTCLACEGDMTHDQVYKHVSTEDHKDNIEASQVVTSLDDEFIRLLNTQKYHCGFCNIVTDDWSELQSHLESFRHEDAKTSACWRLERYHPHLRHCTTREVRSILCSISRVTRE